MRKEYFRGVYPFGDGSRAVKLANVCSRPAPVLSHEKHKKLYINSQTIILVTSMVHLLFFHLPFYTPTLTRMVLLSSSPKRGGETALALQSNTLIQRTVSFVGYLNQVLLTSCIALSSLQSCGSTGDSGDSFHPDVTSVCTLFVLGLSFETRFIHPLRGHRF
jgi:hypothetical protein